MLRFKKQCNLNQRKCHPTSQHHGNDFVHWREVLSINRFDQLFQASWALNAKDKHGKVFMNTSKTLKTNRCIWKACKHARANMHARCGGWLISIHYFDWINHCLMQICMYDVMVDWIVLAEILNNWINQRVVHTCACLHACMRVCVLFKYIECW